MNAPLPAIAAQLGGILARYDRPIPAAAEERKPGRPRKRTPEYLRSVLTKHREVEGWFAQEFEAAPSSDRELYTKYFAYLFISRGQRESRASEPKFQRTLKTTLNELSEARRHQRANPINPAISGTPSAVKS